MNVLPERVAIVAHDPISSEGAAAYLRAAPQYAVLPANEFAQAELLLAVLPEPRGKTLHDLLRMSQALRTADARLVLVADRVDKVALQRLSGAGLTAALFRGSATRDRIIEAMRVRAPAAEPDEARALRLLGAFQAGEIAARYPAGCPHGLRPREVEILELLADGYGTPEIAERLSYSERTIKNVISTLLSRFELRNRSHAVAYALRTGII